MSNSAQCIVHNVANGRKEVLEVNNHALLTQHLQSQVGASAVVANGATATFTHELKSNNYSILIDVGNDPAFDNHAITIEYSPDGTNFYADNNRIFTNMASTTGTFIENGNTAFHSIRVNITNNTGGNSTVVLYICS